MADLDLVTENFFPTAHESFSDTLSSTILAGAATVPITNLSEYDDGDVVVLTVEPGTANEATCVGVKASTPYRLTDVLWTEGNTGVGHNSGVTVIDYDSATHYNLLTKFLKMIANQDGSLKTQPIRDALGLGAAAVNGWEVSPYTYSVTSGYNKGNKEFEITVANADVTDEYSPGMRLRLQRGTAAPTQCADLESGSSQYASKTTPSGLTFTDDYTLEAWVKPESYPTTSGSIVSRYDGSTGFVLDILPSGQVRIVGAAATTDLGTSYQSLSLNLWAHVAATLDMSGSASTIYINGVSVPLTYTNGAATSITQAGNLQVGAANGTAFFDGKISDVRVWNVVRTATQIRDNMNQQLVGSETNLVAYFKLNGNFNDSTANANNLTASGGAVATDTDNPMKTTEYAIITKLAYSAPNTTLTVYTGTDHNIPNMTLTAPYYSTQRAPYGFPSDENKWIVETVIQISETVAIGAIDTWVASLGGKLSVPTGDWLVGWRGPINQHSTVSGNRNCHITLERTTPTNGSRKMPRVNWFYKNSDVDAVGNGHGFALDTLTIQSVFTLYGDVGSASGTETWIIEGIHAPMTLYAKCAYV